MTDPINSVTTSDHLPPKRGELSRILPDGRWALFFDSHTIANFTTCEQKGVYNTIERLRLKGPERTCISIGSWWSKVSEKFYTEVAESGTNFVPIARMATIAIESWVEHNMDSIAVTFPLKYESFAMPTDASAFASILGIQGFDHAMIMAYQKKAADLRQIANSKQPDGTQETDNEVGLLLAEADRLDKLTTLPLGPILMACQYYQQYAENDFRNWTVIGAEKAFGGSNEVMVGEDDKVVLYYLGRPDLVVYESATDSLMPLDQKTKDYITPDCSKIWKPHSQLAGYIFAIQKVARDLGYDRTVDRCIVSICARNIRKTAPKKGEAVKPRFLRVYPNYSQEEIEEWRKTLMLKANRLRTALETQNFVRNDGFECHVFSGCDYRRLCAAPCGAREALKNGDYVQVKAWTPLGEEDDD